jgi:hypothetical protein
VGGSSGTVADGNGEEESEGAAVDESETAKRLVSISFNVILHSVMVSPVWLLYI